MEKRLTTDEEISEPNDIVTQIAEGLMDNMLGQSRHQQVAEQTKLQATAQVQHQQKDDDSGIRTLYG